MEKKRESRVTTSGTVKPVDGFRGPRPAGGMIFWGAPPSQGPVSAIGAAGFGSSPA